MTRPTTDETLMAVAHTMAARSTCSRKHVGAVISMFGRIITSGYNGAPSGTPHCVHSAADVDTGCDIATHAEENAIFFAARYGMHTAGATLHTTCMPCARCSRAIINAGITKVVWDEPYRDIAGIKLLNAVGIQTVSFRGVKYEIASIHS
jgi:dCMP deaminase